MLDVHKSRKGKITAHGRREEKIENEGAKNLGHGKRIERVNEGAVDDGQVKKKRKLNILQDERWKNVNVRKKR